MKSIKLKFLLLTLLTFCLGCSVDNSSLEKLEEEEQHVLVEDIEFLILKESKTSNSERYIYNSPNENTKSIIIEYTNNITESIKLAKRLEYSDYFGVISTHQCLFNTNREIWNVNSNKLASIMADDDDDDTDEGTGGPKVLILEQDQGIERVIINGDCNVMLNNL